VIYYAKNTESKIENRIYLKYKFTKNNMEYNLDKLVDIIWTAKYYYVAKLIHTMDSKNRIDFEVLWLPMWTLKALRPLLIEVWVVWKYKLKWDWVKTYYLNPYYAHTWKTVSKELFDSFDEINWGKVY